MTTQMIDETVQAETTQSEEIDFGSNSCDMSYEQIKQVYAGLDCRLAAGTLTPELLATAIRAVRYDQGDGPPYSLGLHWLWNKAQDKKGYYSYKIEEVGDRTIVKRVVPNPLPWLEAFMEDGSLMSAIICHGGVLNAVEDRVGLGKLVFQTYVRFGAHNHDGMIAASFEAGVDPAMLRQAVLARVETCDPKAIETFLKYGCHGVGDLADKSLWGLLRRDELESVLMLSALLAPNLVLSREVADKIEYVLRERAHEVFDAAAAELSTLAGVDMARIGYSYSDATFAIASRLRLEECDTDQAAEFLLKLVISSPTSPKAVFKLLRSKFQAISAPRLCRLIRNLDTVHKKARENDRLALFPVPDGLWNYMEDRLDEDGYVRGKLSSGTYFNRRLNQEARQLQLVADDAIYIHDDFAHRYYPSEGAFVLVKADRARLLTRRPDGKSVYVAVMLPGEGEAVRY